MTSTWRDESYRAFEYKEESMLNAPDAVGETLKAILTLDLTACEIIVGIASGLARDRKSVV